MRGEVQALLHIRREIPGPGSSRPIDSKGPILRGDGPCGRTGPILDLTRRDTDTDGASPVNDENFANFSVKVTVAKPVWFRGQTVT